MIVIKHSEINQISISNNPEEVDVPLNKCAFSFKYILFK